MEEGDPIELGWERLLDLEQAYSNGAINALWSGSKPVHKLWISPLNLSTQQTSDFLAIFRCWIWADLTKTSWVGSNPHFCHYQSPLPLPHVPLPDCQACVCFPPRMCNLLVLYASIPTLKTKLEAGLAVSVKRRDHFARNTIFSLMNRRTSWPNSRKGLTTHSTSM